MEIGKKCTIIAVMTLEEIKEAIDQRVKDLEKTKSSVEKDLAKGPKETLYVRYEKNATRYYKIQDIEKKRYYLSSEKENEIRGLEYKAYLEKLNDIIPAEIALCKKVLVALGKNKSVESVFLGIAPERRHLICPYKIANIDNEIEKFMSFKELSHVSKSNLKSINGEKVRSKSELIIADRLQYYKVPYLYEPSVHMGEDGTVWHPDFYTMNKRTGQTFLWEHFGMLGDGTYCDDFQYKLERYAEFGVFVGKNLIMTTESSTHQLNTDHVDRLIKKYLL